MMAARRFGLVGVLAVLVGAAAGCGVGSPMTGEPPSAAAEAPFRTMQGYGTYYRINDGFDDDRDWYDPYGDRYDEDDYYLRRGGYGLYDRDVGYGARCDGGFVNPSYRPARVVEENAVAFRLRGHSTWRPKCVSAPYIVEENARAFRRIGQSIWQPK
jgi:hypothetical protein